MYALKITAPGNNPRVRAANAKLRGNFGTIEEARAEAYDWYEALGMVWLAPQAKIEIALRGAVVERIRGRVS